MALVKIERVRFATDVSMAGITRTTGTEFRTALSELLAQTASTIIAADPTLKAAANALAEAAVSAQIQEVGLVTAIPKTWVGTSSRASLPIAWEARTMLDTYSDTYSDAYSATWRNDGRFGKEVPFLRNDTGKLFDEHLPADVARKSDIPAAFEVSLPERAVSSFVPVFGARVATAIVEKAPCAVVFAGSSTTAMMPGYVVRLAQILQQTYQVAGAQSEVQKDSDALFANLTSPGVHGYNVGQYNTTSADYLNDAECDRIAALQPALMFHMVGSNDFRNRMHPAQYETNMRSRLIQLDARFTVPCQHVLVHAYERSDFSGPLAPWAQYGDALAKVASGRADTVFVDLSGKYGAVGIPTSDPLNLIGDDNIHQTSRGNRFMADQIASQLVA